MPLLLNNLARQSFPPYNALINENSLPNTVVGTFFAVDGDANAKLKFSLVSNAGGKFKVTTTGSCGPVSKVSRRITYETQDSKRFKKNEVIITMNVLIGL